MEKLSGAYGHSRRTQLKMQSAQQQSQRLAEIRQEQRRMKSLEQQRPKKQKLHDSSFSVKTEAKMKTRLTRLIDIRAGYYEAELLKELKIRKETLDEDVEREDVVPVYRDYQPARLPRISPHRQTVRAVPKSLSRSTEEPLQDEQEKLEQYIKNLDAKLAKLGHRHSQSNVPRRLLRARY